MATPSLSFASISNDLAKGNLRPVYILHGPEAYFIDRLTEEFSALVPEEDRDFNLYHLYGSPQLDPADIVETCRRYPMMSDRQVVILKEAQSMRADQLDKLAHYLHSPTDTTILVVCFRGEAMKGAKFKEAAKAAGTAIFESAKIKEGAVPSALAELVKARGLKIEQSALAMLTEYVGSDLAKLYGAVDKLALVLPPNATVTPESVETNIGISKDYNTFELTNALSTRNAAKALTIVDYFSSNPKANPTPVIAATLFSHFANLLTVQMARDKSEKALMAAIGTKSAWTVKKFQEESRLYNPFQVIEIIAAIRDFDARSKGIGSRQNPYDLLRDLIFHILTAPGDISF